MQLWTHKKKIIGIWVPKSKMYRGKGSGKVVLKKKEKRENEMEDRSD